MRVEVPLRQAYKLINHGPTTLISSAAAGQVNVMAAAWVMPLDFDPARLVAIIEADSLTRKLVDASGELVVNVPTAAMVDMVYAVGSVSGSEVEKLGAYGIRTARGSQVAAPLIEGCAAHLECRVVPEPAMAERYDLFIADVVAAWADDAAFKNGAWQFSDAAMRTLHHVAKGVFFTTGERLEAKKR